MNTSFEDTSDVARNGLLNAALDRVTHFVVDVTRGLREPRRCGALQAATATSPYPTLAQAQQAAVTINTEFLLILLLRRFAQKVRLVRMG